MSSAKCKNVKANGESSSSGQKKKGLISSLYNSSSKEQVVKESDLITKAKNGSPITPDDVMKLNKITDGYLCKKSDNIYEIDFVKFKLRDIESNSTLFEVCKPDSLEIDLTDGDDSSRFIRYNFAAEFLRLKKLGATVEFTVGKKPVNKFLMIERHYFGETLLKSFDFEFGFCVPNSRNTMEHIYDFPSLSESMIEKLIQNPYLCKSDTFYFADNRLIMHNKADYSYQKH